MSDRFCLDSRRALVTGAIAGIGQAIAVALARAGAEKVGCTARRDTVEGVASTPAGRLIEPKDTAGAGAVPCSPAAGYIHGAVLNVDGGWLAC